MDTIEKIEWEPKYSVSVEEIDLHQKKMLDLFNELIDMKKSNVDARECLNQISIINDYSKIFFSTEERILRRKGYPDFIPHLKSHRNFTKNFITLRREISEDVGKLTYEAIDGLRGWLINHILDNDSLYVPFLRINQYIEDFK